MTYDRVGRSGLDYIPCRYGASRTLFRGPRADLNGPHVLFLGGTTTYGKFIPRPFPSQIEARTHLSCVNLGAVNAGPDLFLNDPIVMEMAQRASATVVQITGAPNLTNRYYSVHPRRNDRFLQASALLRTIYRDVDFTAFHFTRHLLQHLMDLSPDRFRILLVELKEAWVARMIRLIEEVGSPVVLLWMADHALADAPGADGQLWGRGDPLFVDRGMVDQLRDRVTDVVEVVARDSERAAGTEGMVFSQMEYAAAQSQLGVGLHHTAAEALAPVLCEIVPKDTPVFLN
ncbi:DUF6473 family protein [Pseudooceanicola sp.]|uniref:DUF6473 family protein n=1 Tax=Pseudooceanicola sp. TaxID=1914328 RepID=UPI0035C72A45